MPMRIKTHGQLEKVHAPGKPAYNRASPSERGYGRTWQKLRLRILRRDHYMCVKCRVPVGKSGEVDHIIGKAKGGTNRMDNLQTLCKRCHSMKTAREDGGFGT